MSRRTAAAILAFVALALSAGGCGGDDDEPAGEAAATTEAAGTTEAGGGTGGGTLSGSVGPGFSISLDGTDGLTAGDYTITVDDLSGEHNFHLTGPGGVDVSTAVGEEGEESFDVTLEPGEYTFVCDPHASQMRGRFTVG
jgi:plastocyanin